jgi:hypothetical protein
MSNVLEAFNRNRAKKNVIIGGVILMACITLLSCFSSFMIYREGFADMGPNLQNLLSLFAVVVVEGAFIWLVYGFTRAFSSFLERTISFCAMWALTIVMLINIATHFMMVKRIPLNGFQQAWLAWGAVSVFIGVLVIVLALTIVDPIIRLIRLELRYIGKQEETILEAKTEGLNSDLIRDAMADRAEWEAGQLAAKIMGNARQAQPQDQVGFPTRAQSQTTRRQRWTDQGWVDEPEDQPRRRYDSH